MAVFGIPGPAEALRLADQAQRAVREAIALVPRLVAVVGQVEEIVAAVGGIVASVDLTQRRAADLVARVDPLLGRFEPILDRLEPIAARLADTTSPAEVDALVTLVDRLPRIVAALDADILPILTTLGTVAPDLHELLDAAKELNEIITQIPGLRRKRDDEPEG